jgi:hypothetical protein
MREGSRRGLDGKNKQRFRRKNPPTSENRCGYCLNPQELMPFKLEIEHIYPQALGGKTIE